MYVAVIYMMLQAIKTSKTFANKMSGSAFDLGRLTELQKSSINLLAEGRALYSEGLMIMSLSNPMDQDSAPCIRAELAAIAGKSVKETLIDPRVLVAAREMIG